MFPYLDKYPVSDYLPKLTDRISCLMEEYKLESPCDRALLLDYKAECFLLKKDYGNAVKKCEKAINIMEKLHTKDADMRTANLLSNLYNNLSNTYLLMKRGIEAANALHTAFDIRMDYGIFKLSRGIIDMMEGKPESAEMNLLGAESIIGNAIGTDNDYMKTTYRYLNNLYARWKKPEKAIEYRDKFLNNRKGV